MPDFVEISPLEQAGFDDKNAFLRATPAELVAALRRLRGASNGEEIVSTLFISYGSYLTNYI